MALRQGCGGGGGPCGGAAPEEKPEEKFEEEIAERPEGKPEEEVEGKPEEKPEERPAEEPEERREEKLEAEPEGKPEEKPEVGGKIEEDLLLCRQVQGAGRAGDLLLQGLGDLLVLPPPYPRLAGPAFLPWGRATRRSSASAPAT